MRRFASALLVLAFSACELFPDVSSVTSGGAGDGGATATLVEAGAVEGTLAEGGSEDAGESVLDGGVGVVDAASSIDASLGKYAMTVMADSPEVYLPLDEASGLAVFDVSGHGHDGLLNAAAVRVQGQRGLAVDFGLFASLSLGLDLDFKGTAPFTFEAWVKIAFSDSEYRALFSQSAGNGAARQGYSVLTHETTLLFERYSDGKRAAIGEAAFQWFGKWTHVVSVFDGKSVGLWVNGAPQGTAADTQAQGGKMGAPFLIGARTPSGEGAFLGTVDDVAIYATALSEKRIQAHYNAGVGAQ